MGADEDGRHPVWRAATAALRGRLERANPGPFSVGQGSMPARRNGGGMGFDGDRGVSRRARPPGLWPADSEARAWARSAAAEMHSGFSNLRNEFGMNLRLREKRIASPAVAAEIERITEIWRGGRERFGEGGGFLCGSFGIVDAFYCPVAFRFQNYGVALTGECAAYHQHLIALPAMQEWLPGAVREPEHIARFDAPAAQGQQQ